MGVPDHFQYWISENIHQVFVYPSDSNNKSKLESKLELTLQPTLESKLEPTLKSTFEVKKNFYTIFSILVRLNLEPTLKSNVELGLY